MGTTLTADEIDQCRRAFSKFDKDSSGTISIDELRDALVALGQQIPEEDLFIMISQADEDDSGEIEFPEFLKVIENQKESMGRENDESDTIDAFVALGGQADKTGKISISKLAATVQEFDLNIDVQKLVKEVDKDKSGYIEYEELKAVLK